jgi:hypothetical protein
MFTEELKQLLEKAIKHGNREARTRIVVLSEHAGVSVVSYIEQEAQLEEKQQRSPVQHAPREKLAKFLQEIEDTDWDGAGAETPPEEVLGSLQRMRDNHDTYEELSDGQKRFVSLLENLFDARMAFEDVDRDMLFPSGFPRYRNSARKMKALAKANGWKK